jgi:hypothetical protein
LRPGVLVAILLPVAIAVLSYLPIIADFRATTAHAHFAPGGSEITAGGAQATAEMTYEALLGPCLTLIVFSFFLVAAGAIVHRSWAGEEKQTSWPISELVLIVALLGAPIIAVCMAVIEKSQYFPRYVSWAVAGFALLLGSVSGGRQSRSIVGLIIAALLSLLLLRNFATPLRKRLLQGEVLTSYTPADTLASYVKSGDPTGLHELLDNDLPDLPLLTPSVKDFVYIEYYSPVLRSRTHYVYASDLSYGRYYVDSFRSYFAAPFTEPLKTTDVTKLSRFLFYGSMKEDVPDLLGVLAAGGRTLSYKVSPDGSHFLLEVESPMS